MVIPGAYDFQRLTFLTTCLRGFILRRIWSKSTPHAPQTRQTFGSLTWKFNSFSSQNSWEVLSENKRKLGRHWTYLIVSPISNRNSKYSKLSCIRFSGNIEWNNIPLKISFKEMHCIELRTHIVKFRVLVWISPSKRWKKGRVRALLCFEIGSWF